jgi:hypothetical protein
VQLFTVSCCTAIAGASIRSARTAGAWIPVVATIRAAWISLAPRILLPPRSMSRRRMFASGRPGISVRARHTGTAVSADIQTEAAGVPSCGAATPASTMPGRPTSAPSIRVTPAPSAWMRAPMPPRRSTVRLTAPPPAGVEPPSWTTAIRTDPGAPPSSRWMR